MEKISKYFGNKGVSFYILLAASLCQVIGLILYGATGVTMFTAKLSTAVIVFGILFIILAIAVTVSNELKAGGAIGKKAVGMGAYFVYLSGLLSWLFYVTGEVNYLTSIFVSIDGTSLTASFVLTVLFSALAWIGALVSAIIGRIERTDKVDSERAGEVAGND